MTNQWTVAWVVVGVVGCTSQVPLENSKCPCPASLGYMCCGTGSASRCVRPTLGETCNPEPVADASLPLFDAGPQPIDASPEDAPPVLSPIAGIAIGRAHACAVRADYTVTCMGDNSKGQASPPPGVLFYSVTASGDMSCGIIFDRVFDKNGQTVCWGDNSFGQSAMPPGVQGSAAGLNHACGYDPNGNVVCWGDNSLGQTNVPSGPLTNLTVGHNHNCAIRTDNDAGAAGRTIVCWGDNSLGQTAVPKLPMLPPVPVLIASGDHTCAMDGAYSVWCWGDHRGGQSTPPLAWFDNLAVGPGHACGVIHGDDHVTCWGDDWGGALPGPPSGKFLQVWLGDYLSCVAVGDGAGRPPICWGTSYQPWY